MRRYTYPGSPNRHSDVLRAVSNQLNGFGGTGRRPGGEAPSGSMRAEDVPTARGALIARPASARGRAKGGQLWPGTVVTPAVVGRTSSSGVVALM